MNIQIERYVRVFCFGFLFISSYACYSSDIQQKTEEKKLLHKKSFVQANTIALFPSLQAFCKIAQKNNLTISLVKKVAPVHALVAFCVYMPLCIWNQMNIFPLVEQKHDSSE